MGLSLDRIVPCISETYATVTRPMRENRHGYVWEAMPSVDALGRVRLAALDAFLADYATGERQGRYRAEILPAFACADRPYGLALCAHFLFLYSGRLTAEFHLQAVLDRLQVADEARIFPLLALHGAASPHLDFVAEKLAATGHAVEISRVQYEFQRGGNQFKD